MKRLNNYFFGTEAIGFENGIWFYGTYSAVAAVTAFVMISIN